MFLCIGVGSLLISSRYGCNEYVGMRLCRSDNRHRADSNQSGGRVRKGIPYAIQDAPKRPILRASGAFAASGGLWIVQTRRVKPRMDAMLDLECYAQAKGELIGLSTAW